MLLMQLATGLTFLPINQHYL